MLGKGDVSQARHDAFVSKARKVHGNKYDYVQAVIRVGDDNPKVVITCDLHGDFSQRIGSHLQGCGCSKCGSDSRYGVGKQHKRVVCKYCSKPRRMSERWISGAVCSDCKHHHQMTSGNCKGLSPWERISRQLARLACRNSSCRRVRDEWWLWSSNKRQILGIRSNAKISSPRVVDRDNWLDAVKVMTHTWKRQRYEPNCVWQIWARKKRGSMKTAEKLTENRTVAVSSKDIYELITRQQFKCAITGDELSPADATIDHIIPVSMGGSNDIGNLQVVTKAANRIKGALTMDQLIGLCQRIVDKHGNSCGIANDRTSGET
jgi:hypothetical protein